MSKFVQKLQGNTVPAASRLATENNQRDEVAFHCFPVFGGLLAFRLVQNSAIDSSCCGKGLAITMQWGTHCDVTEKRSTTIKRQTYGKDVNSSVVRKRVPEKVD